MRRRNRSRVRFLATCLSLLGAAALGGGAGPAAAACPNDQFRIGASESLPDCRAWELVSPAAKRNDVAINSSRFRSAQYEAPGLPMAAIFQSPGGFADPQGSGIAFDYMAQRTLQPGTQGWTTHGITPLQDQVPFSEILNGYDPLYLADGDPGLTKMVHRTLSALTPAPNLDKTAKLFLRTDLRSPGAGDYQLLNDPGFPVTLTQEQSMKLAGESTDLRTILFESRAAYTADAPSSTDVTKVYKSVDGVIQLVSVLPADEGGVPAPIAVAGQGAGALSVGEKITPNALSDDGSRAFFTVPVGTNNLDRARGKLYMRDDQGTESVADDTTVRIDASERTEPDEPAPATYWNAAADGSRVFFTSVEALTDDAPTGSENLYVYDTTRPPVDDNLTYISADNEPGDPYRAVKGVMDVTLDGRSAYFIQIGQIVPGEPLLKEEFGMYAWTEGEGVRYIGQGSPVMAGENVPGITHGLTDQWGASISEDGRYFLVSLIQPPWPGSPPHGECNQKGIEKGCKQFYLYDSESGEHPVCVSCDPAGSVPTSDAFFFVRLNAGASFPGTHRPRVMPADGSHVFFTTAEALVPTDLNGATDVYDYDVAEGVARLITSGTSPGNSYFLEVSPSGKDVFVATGEPLSPWDPDLQMDVYDARAGGGVPAPPPAPPECLGESCRAPAADPPAALSPPSALLTSAAGLSERRSCAPVARRARALSHRAASLRRQARRADSPRATARLKRRAARLSKRSKRASRKAEQCRRANRRSGR